MATTVVSEHDVTKPIIVRKVLSARNDAGMRTEVSTAEFGGFAMDEPTAHGGTGTAPSPLQVVLGALCGCESVTFNRAAAEMGFRYSGIDFAAAFTIDIRGRKGVRGIRPHFQTVKLEATVKTDESEARLRAVVEETEARCPVFNLLQDANVRLETLWIRKASQ
ncbi:MAG: OsmC family protein [Pseudomonadota bacterium]